MTLAPGLGRKHLEAPPCRLGFPVGGSAFLLALSFFFPPPLADLVMSLAAPAAAPAHPCTACWGDAGGAIHICFSLLYIF